MLTKRFKNILFFAGVIFAGLAVGYGAPRLFKAFETHHQQGDYAAYFPAQDVRAVVYGTADCSFCKQTRAYLEGKGIRYVFADVQASKKAAAQHAQLGGGGVPAILIGDQRIQGFWPGEIDDALLAAGQTGH